MSRLFEHLDSQIFCHHSCDQNPESIRFYLHAHDKLELFYFISGNVDYIVEGAVYQLTPGDIVITHSAEVHQPIIHPGAPYERISIQFDDALIRDIDSSGLLLKPFWDRSLGCSNLYSFQGRSASGLLPCFEDFDLPSSPEEKRLNIIAVLLRCMLWISHQFETISQAEKYPLADGVASELINYINQELFSKISLATIGQRFFLSKSQINRIFRKATGSSVWEYILIKRLFAARERILAGESVYTAAANCGFQDYSAFYRAYVARFQVSPSKAIQQNAPIVDTSDVDVS